MELKDLFTKNLSSPQKQYEAIRAVAFQEGSMEEIAKRYGYKASSLRSLISKVLTGQHILFPKVKRGPRGRRVSDDIQRIIYTLRRKKRLNSRDIAEELKKEGICVSVRTVERVLSDGGFPKLARRSYREMGISKKGSFIPVRSENIDMKKLGAFRTECQVGSKWL